MLFKPNPTSGVPIYVQLMEQIKHAIETGALRTGDQLPGIRKVAAELVINPNTIAKVYKELEHAGIIELRQGSGAFVGKDSNSHLRSKLMQETQPLIQEFIAKLASLDLTEEEIRRQVEAELSRRREFRNR